MGYNLRAWSCDATVQTFTKLSRLLRDVWRRNSPVRKLTVGSAFVDAPHDALAAAQNATWNMRTIGLNDLTNAAGTCTLPSMVGRSRRDASPSFYIAVPKHSGR